MATVLFEYSRTSFSSWIILNVFTLRGFCDNVGVSCNILTDHFLSPVLGLCSHVSWDLVFHHIETADTHSCTYTFMYKHPYTHTHTHTCTNTHIHTHMHQHTCMHAHTHIHMISPYTQTDSPHGFLEVESLFLNQVHNAFRLPLQSNGQL